MSIRRQVSWDASQQRFVGHVDLGNGPDSDAADEATEALVFMVVGIFCQFKQPFAYFLTHGVTGYTLSQLLRHAIQTLHDIGVTVVTLTLDGHQSNQAALKQLGVSLKDNICSFFKHPSDHDVKIMAFFDPPHMLKLVRNALHAYGKLLYLWCVMRRRIQILLGWLEEKI